MRERGRSGRQRGDWQWVGDDDRVSTREVGSVEGRDVVEIVLRLVGFGASERDY
jgi:hypothetical protein